MGAYLLYHHVNPEFHLLDAFTTWAAIPPNVPAGPLGLDLGREQSLILAVIPLPYLLCDDMVWQLLNVVKEEVEGLVGSDTGRYHDGA